MLNLIKGDLYVQETLIFCYYPIFDNFLLLTIGVMTNASIIHYLDNALFNLVALTYRPWLTTVMIYITSIGSPLIVTILAMVLFILNRHKGKKHLFSSVFTLSQLA